MKIASREEAERFLRKTHGGGELYFRLSSARSHLEYLQMLSREAATWCSAQSGRAPARTSLRTDSLRPSVLPRTRWDCVGSVALKRRNDLRWQSIDPTGDHAGRLLLYFPDLNLADGAAEAESEGFFDGDNAPPYGSWIAYFEDDGAESSHQSYLLSWVPADLVPLANAGIGVNPEECIVWAAATDLPVKQVLALAGILC